jgi:hypothetical protein
MNIVLHYLVVRHERLVIVSPGAVHLEGHLRHSILTELLLLLRLLIKLMAHHLHVLVWREKRYLVRIVDVKHIASHFWL